MNESAAANLIDLLIDNARRILLAGFGVNRIESTFFDIVGLLQEENSLKCHFLARVRATLALSDPGRLDPEMVPRELIELVAHELRWPELEDLARKRIDDFLWR